MYGMHVRQTLTSYLHLFSVDFETDALVQTSMKNGFQGKVRTSTNASDATANISDSPLHRS